MTDDEITCPVCDAGPWPDTYGADGGRRKRILHMFAEHDDLRGNPWSKID